MAFYEVIERFWLDKAISFPKSARFTSNLANLNTWKTTWKLHDIMTIFDKRLRENLPYPATTLCPILSMLVHYIMRYPKKFWKFTKFFKLVKKPKNNKRKIGNITWNAGITCPIMIRYNWIIVNKIKLFLPEYYSVDKWR